MAKILFRLKILYKCARLLLMLFLDIYQSYRNSRDLEIMCVQLVHSIMIIGIPLIEIILTNQFFQYFSLHYTYFPDDYVKPTLFQIYLCHTEWGILIVHKNIVL